MSHTPGPWVRFLVDGQTLAIMPAGRPGDVVAFKSPPDEEADARLIAAAPDLLEACKHALSCCEEGAEIMCERLRAAIAKATKP